MTRWLDAYPELAGYHAQIREAVGAADGAAEGSIEIVALPLSPEEVARIDAVVSELNAITALLDESGVLKSIYVNGEERCFSTLDRVDNLLTSEKMEEALKEEALAEHRKLRALLVRLRDDSVMEDGFMTNAVGHRLLALGKVARELLTEVPER